MSPRLTATDIAIFHQSIYIPSMRYSLAAIAADEEALAPVQSKIIQTILQKLHISSTTPTSLRHGPIELGGLGMYDLRTEAGVEALKFLSNLLYSDSEAGNLIRLNIQYSQRKAGVGYHILEQPDCFIQYLTPSWILSLRQFLSNHNMTLTISDLHLDPLQGPQDEYISMTSEHLNRYTPVQQQDLNLVRMWLQVSTLSQMTDPKRPNCIELAYLDAQRPTHFIHQDTWSRQQAQSKAQCRLWKRFIRSSYLRYYTPYWKTVTLRTVPLPSVHEPPSAFPPITLLSLQEYIASNCSRAERRLLDGLDKVATNDQVWKAFRSRSRLYLASDGGLSESSATHGWILSTNRNVLFKCSGPVDGPFDTNNSPRCELGGCASALLLISSVTQLWGTKHRCSFLRWYTDNTSAISRFNRFCRRNHSSSRMPNDADLITIIKSSLRQLKRPFRPIWVKAHQDNTISYDKLSFTARLNIDADFLATRYRHHGRLRNSERVDHRREQQVSLCINGTPITCQYDACIRFHVNGFHHQQYVQQHHQWDNGTWDSVDFYTFGRHFKRLRPSHRIQHFKFVHDSLPLGVRRFREAAVKDETLQLCPSCRTEPETPLHFLYCSQNPAFDSSWTTLRSEVINKDSHPVRYLLVAGLLHATTSTDTFRPTVDQFPSHFASVIASALQDQQSIGWSNAFKGYFSKQWTNMAQVDMYTGSRDMKQGATRMK